MRSGQDIDDPHYRSKLFSIRTGNPHSTVFRDACLPWSSAMVSPLTTQLTWEKTSYPCRWYLTLLVSSLSVGIGCLYGAGTSAPLMPWWSVILFTSLSAFFAVFLGFSKSPRKFHGILFTVASVVTATTGFNISVKGAIQVLAAFVHPGKPM